MKKRAAFVAGAGAGAVVLTAAMLLYLRWIIDFAINSSDDVTKNFVHIIGMMVVMMAVVFLEALLLREVYHRFRSGEGGKWDGRDGMKEEIRRRIKETSTMWAVLFVVPLLLNVLVLNYASGRKLLNGELMRVATTVTLLRSGDAATRDEGIGDAVALPARTPGRYLARIISKRGPEAAHAAWAVASRKDVEAIVPLRWMFLKGDQEQRRVAIISLARLADPRGAELATIALERGEQPELEISLALGIYAHFPALPVLEAVGGDAKRTELVRAAAFWSISKIEQERFRLGWIDQGGPDVAGFKVPERQGWKPLVAGLEDKSLVVRCAAIQALRYAGPVDTVDDVQAAFERAPYNENCPSLAIDQYRSTRYEFVAPGLFRSYVINALSGIGNRRIVGWLDKQAGDRKNADEVILKAGDLARQIREIP